MTKEQIKQRIYELECSHDRAYTSQEYIKELDKLWKLLYEVEDE